jgi:hypothetical protein
LPAYAGVHTLPEMGTEPRKRYTFKDVPGATVTISFRIPESASLLLTERVARSDDLATRTEALQDALVTWLMVEEWKESENGRASRAPGNGTTA